MKQVLKVIQEFILRKVNSLMSCNQKKNQSTIIDTFKNRNLSSMYYIQKLLKESHYFKKLVVFMMFVQIIPLSNKWLQKIY